MKYLKPTTYLFAILVLFSGIFWVIKTTKGSGNETRAEILEINEFKKSELSEESKEKLKSETVATLALSKTERSQSFESKVFKADFDFNAIASIWESTEANLKDIKIELNLSENSKDWQGWTEINIEDDLYQPKEDSDPNILPKEKYGDLLITETARYFKYKITLIQVTKSPEFKKIKFNYINTLNGPEPNKTTLWDKFLGKAEAATGPRVITRAQWGANPAYHSWPAEYARVNKFVYHHTVSGNNPSNPTAVVRSIYYYHAITRGWGDIGYNFLIDHLGNIYHGRAGGNGVIGAHAYGYNTGSIGISMIGTFTSANISSAAFNSLTSLLGYKAYINGIDVRLYGHRDVNATACPGDRLFSRKAEIKSVASSKLQNYLIKDKDFLDNNDNVLIKGNNSATVYLYKDGKKRHILNMASLWAWGLNDKPIYTVYQIYVNEIPNGPPISLIVKKSGTNALYLIDNESKRKIPNMSIFDAWGFSNKYTASISTSEFNSFPTFPDLTRFIKTSDSAQVYMMSLGKKRAAPNPELDFIYRGSEEINTISDRFMGYISSGPTLSRLAKAYGSNKIYFLSLDGKRQVANLSTIYGLSEPPYVSVPSSFITSKTTKEIINLVAKSTEGKYYLIDQGQKKEFENLNTLKAYKLTGYIGNVSDAFLNLFSSGNKIYRAAKGTAAQVYMIDFSCKYKIPNPDVLSHWDKGVSIVSNRILARFKTTRTLSRLAKGTTPKVYFIDNGEKKYVVSPLLLPLLSLSGSKAITPVSNSLLNSVPNGTPISFAVKGSGPAIYLLSGGKKKQFPNVEVLESYGLGGSDCTVLSDTLIAKIPTGSVLTRLIKGKRGGAIYYMHEGKRRQIYNLDALTAHGFSLSNLTVLDNGVVGSFIKGDFLTRFNKISSSDASVFYIRGKVKHLLKNYQSYFSWSGDSPARVSTFSEINSYPTGAELSYAVKGSSAAVYLIDRGAQKRHIGSTYLLGHWGISGAEISEIPDGFLNSLPTLRALTRLIKQHNRKAIYYVQEGKKYLVPDMTVFRSFGFKTGNIRPVSAATLNLLPNSGSLIPNVKAVRVKANGYYYIKNLDGTKTYRKVGGATVTYIRYYGSKYYVTGPNFAYILSHPVKLKPASTSVIMEILSYSDPNWNGTKNLNRFRGSVIVQYSSTSNKVWAINEVRMEDYLKGLAEASNSGSTPYLSTMATAARTYAYYHYTHNTKHAGEPFHLKNSRRGNGADQVYAGYKMELAMPNFVAAVNRTIYKIVKHSGQVILAAYSHGYKGRTRSSQEVWGYYLPYLISVADPYADTLLPCGTGGNHCVGLSASGANGYGARGKGYVWILTYFYKGTGVSNSAILNPRIKVAIYYL